MNDSKNDSFLDSKTILAIVLCGLVFFGWQTYLAKKYPVTTATTVSSSTTSLPTTLSADQTTGAALVASPAVDASAFVPSQKRYEFENLSFDLSNSGLSISNVVLNKFKDRQGLPMKLGDESASFYSFQVNKQDVPFQLTQTSEREVVGKAVLTDGTQIIRNLKFNPESYSITEKISIQTAAGTFFNGFQIKTSEKWWKPESSSFLFPSFDHQDIVTVAEDKTHRENASSHKETFTKTYPSMSMGSIGSQYFVAGAVDRSTLAPGVEIEVVPNQQSQFSLVYKLGQNNGEQIFELTYYLGPKSIDTLSAVDKQLAQSINLGFFASIGKVLLLSMKWFHGFFPNWGVAIILLTLLVRVLVLPFNLASYKSMKKMQEIQPLIQSLRERYKDDPTKLNGEMMSLMKENKVNPIGGCLPMLLQMPVFFALYQVFGQSVELYQAPFIFWIHDLTLKDPFFVLPVLMGVTMYIQQKITPTTMDPMQAKILQWLPVVFSLMMVALPSGLTLYIFISTLFGVIQQKVFMSDSKTAKAA